MMPTREELTVQLRKAIEERRDDVFEIAANLVEPDLDGRDARQLEHLRLADEMEVRLRSLPRVGATFTAHALFQGSWAHRMMAEMTLDEERAWLAESEGEEDAV